VLLLMTILLVLAGVVLLLVGYAQDSLTLIYLSIGCGAVAGVLLIILAHFNRVRAARLVAAVSPSSLRADAQPGGGPLTEQASQDAGGPLGVPAAGVLASERTAARAAGQSDSAAQVPDVAPAQGAGAARPMIEVDREATIEADAEARSEAAIEAGTGAGAESTARAGAQAGAEAVTECDSEAASDTGRPPGAAAGP
jgi:hypothetical protein